MGQEILKILSEELGETKNLVVETRRMADAAEKKADAAMKEALAAEKKSDAAWELVVMTRNQIQEEMRYLRLPWWKNYLELSLTYDKAI
jgi:hypothetical protein